MMEGGRASSVGRKGGKAMIAKPNSRLMVKVPSKLRTALTSVKTADPNPKLVTSKQSMDSLVPAASAPSTGRNRCCCCCLSSLCSKSHSSDRKAAPLPPDPLLQQPVNMGSKNVRGIVKFLTEGTAEAKDLILNECEIIFECKICRSLFRSFSNFLDHKRDFCQQHACENMMLFGSQSVRQESTARSPSAEQNGATAHIMDTGSGPYDEPGAPGEILKNGIQVPASRRSRSLDVCIQKLMHDKSRSVEQTSPALILTPITTTTRAVFQTHMDKIEEDSDGATQTSDAGSEHSESVSLLKSALRVDKPVSQDMLSSDPAAKLPIGEVFVDPVTDLADESSSQLPVTCGICASEFVSNKTLRVHMKTLHASQRLIYPCPFCCLTFTQICNATRHMHQIHKKGKMDVKRLRDVVRQRARIADEVVHPKSPEKHDSDPGFSEEMDMTPEADHSIANDSSPKAGEPALEIAVAPAADKSDSKVEKEDSGPGHVCQGCNKFFPRIASKIGHEKVCEALKKPVRKKVKTNCQTAKTDDGGYHPFDPIYDNEPLTITAMIKAGLQKVASTKKLKCYECPTLKFKNNVHLIRHAVAHMNQEIFACNNCVYQSLSKADIDSHAATFHGNEPVKGSPPNKIIITPSEIVVVRDQEFSCNGDSSVNSPVRAVSAYNTTRLKTKSKELKKKKALMPHLLPLAPQNDLPVPDLVLNSPATDSQSEQNARQDGLSDKVTLPVPVCDLPPPPPLMPQPTSAVAHEVTANVLTEVAPPPIVPAVVQMAPDVSTRLPVAWPKRGKKLRRLVPSLPVPFVTNPFGGQIKKRIQQAKKLKRKEKVAATTAPAADPTIQPLKILIHKGVTSGKKITYAVTKVSDQSP